MSVDHRPCTACSCSDLTRDLLDASSLVVHGVDGRRPRGSGDRRSKSDRWFGVGNTKECIGLSGVAWLVADCSLLTDDYSV